MSGRACTVTCVPGGERVTVEAGATLMRAIRAAGVSVPNLCGNHALCVTCAAQVLDGLDALSRPGRAERRMLRWIGAPDSVRLTCQAKVRGDIVVRAAISPIERLDYDPSDLPWEG
ncbi:MAG: 2Fe-2S iron-sulfur cluster-binding protein [Acidimicrobiia bacterium]